MRSVLLLVGASIALGGCAALGGASRPRPLHLSDLSETGDPAFRASLRLVLDGLDADEAGRRDSALVLYERALQVDPINPYAYLAIARHRVEGEDPESALPFLDKAETLLESRGELSLGAEAHITGLRGTALLATGRRSEAFQHFEEARTLDPLTWSDGRLSPSELR